VPIARTPDLVGAAFVCCAVAVSSVRAQTPCENQAAPILAGSASLSVGTMSTAGAVALPAAVNPYTGAALINDGAVDIFVALGSSSVTATTGGLVILPASAARSGLIPPP
jgi:hypothetical protein